jgi:iron complex transport system substrate-binding protein
MKKPVWLLILLMVSSCYRTGRDRKAGETEGPQGTYTRYAKGFDVQDYGRFRLVRVFDPWQNSRDVILTYALAAPDADIPDSLVDFPVIRVPVHRVITLSTTHTAMINQLGMGGSIAGLSGSRYVYDPEIRKRIDAGEILDVGYDQGLNYEAIVSLDPDVVFIYGVENNMKGISEKLADLGIPAVFCGEYLERHPLGKAEWIRFFALFYGLEQESEHFFQQIDSSYNALVTIAGAVQSKPRVLNGLPWKDTWYVAGGRSFAARLIRDAGGDYLWSDHPSDEAVPLDLESVYVRAVKADVWINPGAAVNLGQLARFDERFQDLPVLRNGEVYNNDNRMGPGGGNDYWESGTVRPDLVLADLIKVFHPDLLTDHPYIYYRKLK